jgi:Zn-dependent protease with chaperone function
MQISAPSVDSFCTNCGTAGDRLVCSRCGLDPRVPEGMIEQYLSKRLNMRSAASFIEYPGETSSLLLAVVLVAATGVMLSAVTAGIFAAIIVFSLLNVRLDEHRQRARMQVVGPAGVHRLIFNVTRTAGFRLDVQPPPVFILSQDEPNAFTSGFWGKHWIVLHSKLVSMLTPEELAFVIGHELGHIRREHVTWLILTSGRSAVGIAILRPVIGLIFNSWSLKAEYAADRAGLLACRSFDAAALALIKITYWDGPVDHEAILNTALESTPADFLDRLSELQGDHPYLTNRLKRLQEFDQEMRRKGVL